MSIVNYHDPTVINWNLDDDGQQVSLPIQNEIKQVVDGKIPLEGLPDEQYRIQINGYVEINIRDEIDAPDKFKCDYTHGVLYFHQSKNGAEININKYYSRGQFYIPINRVWTKLGSSGEVLETMENWLLTLNSAVGNESERMSNEAVRVASEIDRILKESDRVRGENNRIAFHDMIRQKLANGDFKGVKGEKGDAGTSLDFRWNGTQLGIKTGSSEYIYSQLKGEQGIQGVQGEQGVQGIKGDKGDKGSQGVQGIKGDKGDKGDSGVSVNVDGNYYFSVEDGDLILHYSDDATAVPNFSINGSGELIYNA